jgi:hypothetical protein
MKLIQAVKVAALVGAVAGMALVAGPQASAATITPAALTAGGTMTLPTLPAKPTIKPDIVPTATSDNCAPVLAHLKDYAARGIKQVACEKTTGTASSPLAHTGTGSVPAIGFPAACANDHWVVTRNEECNLASVHIWTTHDTSTGAVTGMMTYLISQDIRLSTTTSTITESITFDYAGAIGIPAGEPSTVHWTSACGSPCGVASVPTLTFTVPSGASPTFTVTYRDNPLAQAPDTFNISHSYNVILPCCFPPTGNDTWGVPLPIRCDNNTPGFTNPGCVVPAYTPNLILPLSKYGAAAANALVGETKLPGTPGWSPQTPLTRGDPANTNANRSVTCGSFQPFPPGNSFGVVSDSCDEYPFASSQQSGGALTPPIPGSSCLQIVPQQEANGTWMAVNLNPYTGAYPQVCVRGHVNSILNSNVGSQALNPLYTLNRMMVGDGYTVSVTP